MIRLPLNASETSTSTGSYTDKIKLDSKASKSTGQKIRYKSKPRRRSRKASVSKKICEDVKSIEDGIRIITLSKQTQHAIGCVVHVDVTMEYPWIKIPKSRIEDNLDLHQESSEFLPIKEPIINSNEKEILVGLRQILATDMDEFIICTTEDAKYNVLQLLYREEQKIYEKLEKNIKLDPKQWKSLGTETEINMEISRRMRPSYEIELSSDFPIQKANVHFSTRSPEQVRDGYVEFTPEENNKKNVYKKRIDSAVQCGSGPNICVGTQTSILGTRNRNAQTEKYEIPQKTINTNQLTNFLDKFGDYMCEKVLVNSEFGFYLNDFDILPNQIHRAPDSTTFDIASFKETLLTKNKKISAVAWNPLISGIIAAAYVSNPSHYINKSELKEDPVLQAIFKKHYVLIWCYMNELSPKLKLHANRDVTCLSFCPTNGNILLAGTENGQILVWDIGDRLEEVDLKDILTERERLHRNIMQDSIKWMKHIFDISVLYPTAASALEYSHSGPVTEIVWIPSEHHISKIGRISEKIGNINETMQFATTSEDGTVLFWDLSQKGQLKTTVWSRVKSRKRQKPKNWQLTSPFKTLHNKLAPFFKMRLVKGDCTLQLPLRNLRINNYNFKYEETSKVKKEGSLQRNYFKVVEPETPILIKQEFMVCSEFSDIIKCSWEGNDYDQGHVFNIDNAYSKCLLRVHDGPIHTFESNPFDRTAFLSVGGRVFAMWGSFELNKPTIWRKSKHGKYLSGIWSLYYPNTAIIVRDDSVLETWDMTIQSWSPLNETKIMGSNLVDLFFDSTRVHATGGTYVMADVHGMVRINKFVKVDYKTKERILEEAQILRQRVNERRIFYENWLKKCKEKFQQTEAVLEYKEEMESVNALIKQNIREDKSSKKSILQLSNKKVRKVDPWILREEKYMRAVLLKKKHLNPEEFEKHKTAELEMMKAQKNKNLKVQDCIKRKQIIFENAIRFATTNIEYKKRRKINIKQQTDDEIAAKKEKFLQSYNKNENYTLQYIKDHPFQYTYDWSTSIQRAKCRSLLQIVETESSHGLLRVSEVRLQAVFSSSEIQILTANRRKSRAHSRKYATSNNYYY